MLNRQAMLGLAGALVVLLSGCYESTAKPRYEPGVYKGRFDPLHAKLDSGELHEQLSERFQAAARDR